MAGGKIDKVFEKFGAGVHHGEYVTRKELKEILSELSGETSASAPAIPSKPSNSAPGSRRKVG